MARIKLSHRQIVLLGAVCLIAAFSLGATAHEHHAAADPDGFEGGMAAAMERMDQGMMVPATGDVDRDFAQMMIPHHQGAIEMAVLELRFGTNPQLRRLAQEIIVDQQQEIEAMYLALGDALPPETAAPTQAAANHHMHKDH